MSKTVLFLLILLSLPSVVFADRVVNSATVDGATTTSVSAGGTISLTVNVTTTGGGSNNDWESTGWRIASSSGAYTCEDHADFTSAGTASRTFNITAPLVDGTYNLYLVAYQNDNCTGGPSTEFVVSNSVSVGAGSLSCDTFRDAFTNTSYSNQNGTASWSTDWIETGDNGNPNNGDIEISGGRLQLEGDGSGGGRAAFGGEPSIEREADLSAYSSATLTFDYSESGQWEGNDDIEIWISSNGGTSWTLLDTFTNDQTPGSYSRDISAFIAANTRIAFVEKANDGAEIFFFDNVQIEACSAGAGGPGSCGAIGVNYAGYGGASIDLDDSTNNGTNTNDGTYNGNAGLDVGASTPSTGNTVTLPDLDPQTLPSNTETQDDNMSNGETINATSEVFYDNITVTNERTASLTGGGPFHIDNLTIDDESTLNLEAGVYYIDELDISDEGRINVTSEPVIIYIGTSFEMDDDARITGASVTGFRIYMLDGSNRARIRDDSDFTGMIYAPYGADILIEDSDANAQLITTGDLELEDSDLTLSAADATAASSVSTCPEDPPTPTPLAEWRFDEAIWNGVSNEVVDTQGTIPGTAVNGANTSNTTPAVAGNPGTCHYGVFDGNNDYVDLSGMPNLNGSFTITAWIYANSTGNDQRIFADDENNNNGYAFSLGDGGNGRLRFFSRNVNPVSVDTQSAVITSGSWIHVAAVHNVSSKTRQIFVNGVAQTLNSGSTSSTYTGTWGTDSGDASIGGENDSGGEASANYRFDGFIDEVRVYNAALSDSQITDVMNETHACTVSALDHFVINVGAGNGSVCAPFEFTLTAEDASNTTLTSYTGTASLTTSTSNGDFATVTATNTTVPNPDADDNGSASYTFDANDAGTITLSLSNTHAETLTITATDSSIPVTTTSAPVSFNQNAFVITDTDGLVSGDNVAVAGRNHSYRVEMIKQDPTTGSCGVATDYAGAIPLKQWRSKNVSDPSSNQPSLDGTALPDAEPALENGNITFTSGVADVELATTDIGKYTLELADVRFSTDPGNAYSDAVIAGTSVEQIVRPFGIGIDFSNLRDADFANGGLDGSDGDISYAADASGSVFTQAGEDFNITVSAVLWASDDDSGNDGVPDAGAYLGNNAAAPSFGQEGETVTVVVSSASPGSTGAITVNGAGSVFNNFVSGSQVDAVMTYDNVGIMSLSAGLSSGNYFGSGVNITGEAPNVGRFNPFQYEVSANSIINACIIATPFTYARQPFTGSFTLQAQNKAGGNTDGYDGSYIKFASSGVSIENGATAGAFDSLTRSISASGAGSISFDLDLRWDMPFQTVTNADVVLTAINDGDTPAVTTLVANPVTLGSAEIRFGRLAMENVFGSELIDLLMPMYTEYYSGNNFITNIDDGCTTITDPDLAIASALTSGSSTVTVNSPTAVLGILNIDLTAPGSGNTGDISITPALTTSGEDWLQFDWDGDGNFDNDPTGVATFGIYNGNSRQIYYRQNYQYIIPSP